MDKIKNICKNTLYYIKRKKILRHSILVLMFIVITSLIIDRHQNNNIEKVGDTKDIINGTIYTGITSDNVYSRHTLSDGFSKLSDDSSYNLKSSSNNKKNNNRLKDVCTKPNVLKNIDKSSIKGINIEILEGYEFNPKRDLKLYATDKDGSNISDKIIIEKNNVDTSVPGVYSVKASIRLSNGQTKEKEFAVTVKKTKLDVSLKYFRAIKSNVTKNEKIGFDLDFKVSKKYINPVAVIINGKEYTLYKGNENIIDKLINSKNYKVFIYKSDVSGIYDYNLEYVKMSDGTYINLGQNIQTVEILKDKPQVKNFNYQENTVDKKLYIKFDLYDLDNTSSNLRLQLYKNENLLEDIELEKTEKYCISLPVNNTGIYTLKIISDINLNQNIINENILHNEEIFSTDINVSSIDKTAITGNDIEIIKGTKIDFIKDLCIKATDFDGEDITDKINIDANNIDVNIEGRQSILVSVVNKYGNKYTKEFYITVIPDNKTEFSLARILNKNSTQNKIKNSSKRSIPNTSTICGYDTQILKHTVDINGIITKSDGSMPNGKIQVELPTSMAFTVDKNGNFESANYIISNKSSVGISVYVEAFMDSNENSGITVKPIKEDLSGLDRSNLHLALVGNDNRYVDLGEPIRNPKEVLNIGPSNSKIVQLLGQAGKSTNENIDKTGVNDEFTLLFRIKKN